MNPSYRVMPTNGRHKTREALCAPCSRGIFLFKEIFFLFDKPANRKLIQRLVGITAKKKYLEILTSIIDDRPASIIFLNTWIANLLFDSLTIMLQTQETVSLTLTFRRTPSLETAVLYI